MNNIALDFFHLINYYSILPPLNYIKKNKNNIKILVQVDIYIYIFGIKVQNIHLNNQQHTSNRLTLY